MEALKPSDLANLPITDPEHVAKEINWWRQYIEVNRQEQKRRSEYMQVYNAIYKNHERE